ncbi:Tim44/TimA family putative adaptor protein [Paracoccus xiamenensis]|uniref:Tim44/TimA family putative adaptor protein n=1 Tax=Paracoccus xiamenensis TaxID=2714901 RepID=UPI00140E436C|nr:Tim44/TimA family putative adaptor protein [Paracoccus xiamenensis]NHF72966.1 Tim44 domain-containing protein [Paracoccus xiamenensis]
MSNPMLQLIVLAAIAVFLILRLRGVLGTRDGFERPQIDERASNRDLAPIVDDTRSHGTDDDLADHVDASSPAYAALAAMKQAEPSFSLGEFLGGAKYAYEMILVAFEKGDLEPVRPFLSPEVAAAFDSVIEARSAAGQTVEAQFLGTRETALQAAEYDPATRQAELTVRFVGEMISAVKDANGNVIEGDPKSPRKQRDSWSFERVMGSDDPNWRLVATGV